MRFPGAASVSASSLTALVVMFSAVSAQGPSPAPIPRTPDGRPDLQGIYSFANLTPLERPAEFGNRLTITPEEAAEYEARTKVQINERPSLQIAYDARVWRDDGQMSLRTSLIIDPPDGRVPPMLPEAQKRNAERLPYPVVNRPPNSGTTFPPDSFADGPESRTLGERCILARPPGPPMRPESYNNTVQIFQTPNEIALLNEMGHMVRIVPLGPRPPSTIRQYIGESRGRWEGDTLVIETTNFRADAAAFANRGASEHLKLTERISRIDADTLSYEFTINDPHTWPRPWTAQFPLTKEPVLYETACHEGNYGMANILSAVRAAEKKAAGQGPK